MVKKTIQIALLISIIVSFILFLRTTDIHESIKQIRKLDYNLFTILFCTFSAYLLGALGWRNCIDSEHVPHFAKLFMWRHICNIVTLFNPSGAVAGEIFNANMLKQEGVSKEIAYRSVLLSRVMMVISQLLLFLVVIVWFLTKHSQQMTPPIRNILYGALIVFMLLVSLLTFSVLKRGKKKYDSPQSNKWKNQLRQIKEMRSSLAQYIQQRPFRATAAFLFFTLHWVVGSLELYFIINAFGYDISVWDSLFLDTLIIVSKSAVTFIPGQIGAEELINKFALLLLQLTSVGLWLSVSILRRSRQLFWGAVALLFYIGIKQSKRIKYRRIN